ncbi:MAG: oligoendopeptidase F family protein, partial [Clostridiales bacterium]|nr:oligoendopeptidase F family protein [Clostridiales bacterium]
MQLKKRSEIPVEETWNLQALYKTEAAYEKACKALDKRVKAFTSDQTPLKDPAAIAGRIKEFEALQVEEGLLGEYAHLYTASDLTDPVNRERMGKLEMLIAEWRPQLTAFINAIKNLPE